MTQNLLAFPRRDLLVLLGIAVLMLALPGRASAQTSRIVSCSSDDMRYHVCDAGPNRGIRMVRQRSDSPCERNRTYGVRGDQIWVNRGCRADFEVLESNGGYRGGYSRGDDSYVVECSSDDMRRHYCNIGQNRGVRVLRQMSESPCVQGRTYGTRGNQVWVDRGCRAQFEVLDDNGRNDRGRYGRDRDDRGRDHANNDGPGQGVRTVMCGSNDMGLATCDIGPNRGVRVLRQMSESPCYEGRTFGVRGERLWVDRGCRAQFEVYAR